nr:MAG TPA: hypothetical protein [Caudoviricetes sp.]
MSYYPYFAHTFNIFFRVVKLYHINIILSIIILR